MVNRHDHLSEAERLVKAGVKELLVISQDTSAYGVDLKYKLDFWGGRPLKTRMLEMCEALSSMGVWVRLHCRCTLPTDDDIAREVHRYAIPRLPQGEPASSARATASPSPRPGRPARRR